MFTGRLMIQNRNLIPPKEVEASLIRTRQPLAESLYDFNLYLAVSTFVFPLFCRNASIGLSDCYVGFIFPQSPHSRETFYLLQEHLRCVSSFHLAPSNFISSYDIFANVYTYCKKNAYVVFCNWGGSPLSFLRINSSFLI